MVAQILRDVNATRTMTSSCSTATVAAAARRAGPRRSTTAPAARPQLAERWLRAAIGDLDQDNRADLICLNYTTGDGGGPPIANRRRQLFAPRRGSAHQLQTRAASWARLSGSHRRDGCPAWAACGDMPCGGGSTYLVWFSRTVIRTATRTTAWAACSRGATRPAVEAASGFRRRTGL